MSRRLISTGSPFEKTAGYSRAVIDGDFAFVAGTTGYDYTTMVLPDDFTAQARNAFETIAQTLQNAGFALSDLVRVTYYLTSREHVDAMFKLSGEFLGEIRPASTLVIVAGLVEPAMLVEIEATAKRGT